MTTVCQDIASNISGLFTCSESANGFVRIRTPYLYPDGDIIDLFYQKTEADEIILTDLGETLGWLRMQSVSKKRSQKQNQLIDDICQTLGIELFRGMLMVRAKPETLADDLTRLAQASIRVADLWFTLRGNLQISVIEEVADFLTDNTVRFERREKLIGHSGTSRIIDFHTFSSKRSAFVNVLSTGNKAATQSRVDTVVASWLDLRSHQAEPRALRFVSLFDDTIDVWSQENFNMLNEFSEVAYWSRPDEFLELLVA